LRVCENILVFSVFTIQHDVFVLEVCENILVFSVLNLSILLLLYNLSKYLLI
jgi:hypothetical protein